MRGWLLLLMLLCPFGIYKVTIESWRTRLRSSVTYNVVLSYNRPWLPRALVLLLESPFLSTVFRTWWNNCLCSGKSFTYWWRWRRCVADINGLRAVQNTLRHVYKAPGRSVFVIKSGLLLLEMHVGKWRLTFWRRIFFKFWHTLYIKCE